MREFQFRRADSAASRRKALDRPALIDAGHEWLRAVYGVGFALEYPAQSPG